MRNVIPNNFCVSCSLVTIDTAVTLRTASLKKILREILKGIWKRLLNDGKYQEWHKNINSRNLVRKHDFFQKWNNFPNVEKIMQIRRFFVIYDARDKIIHVFAIKNNAKSIYIYILRKNKQNKYTKIYMFLYVFAFRTIL